MLFFLAGRALPEAVGGLAAWPVWRLVAVAGALLAIVLAVQFAFSLPATMLKPIAGSLRAREGSRNLKLPAAGVMAWATTRSVIGLVIALAIPETFPDGRPFGERDLILILAAFLVMGSLLLQGSTLRWAVFRADLCEEGEEKREEEAARRAIEAVAGAGGGDNGEMHDAARRALIKLREEDRIGDEVLLRMLRETDLHARAAEEDVLPGAGPPNP